MISRIGSRFVITYSDLVSMSLKNTRNISQKTNLTAINATHAAFVLHYSIAVVTVFYFSVVVYPVILKAQNLSNKMSSVTIIPLGILL